MNFCELSYDKILNIIEHKNISMTKINLLDSMLQMRKSLQEE